MFMEQINMKYPIGTKVRLEGDYPDDPPREVAGYKIVNWGIRWMKKGHHWKIVQNLNRGSNIIK